jgi:PAS domain-containing protein
MNPLDDALSSIQAITACGIVIRDADDKVIAANQTAARILAGRPGEEGGTWLLRPDGTLLPWEERPVAVAFRTGQAQQQVLVGIASAGGRPRFMRVDVVPVYRDDGTLTWLVCSFVEVADYGAAA